MIQHFLRYLRYPKYLRYMRQLRYLRYLREGLKNQINYFRWIFHEGGTPPPPFAENNQFFPTFFIFLLLAQNDVHVVKWILYDMGNSSQYFLIPSWRWEHVAVVSIQVGCQGWGGVIMVKKILLLYFMFQSILNILRAS